MTDYLQDLFGPFSYYVAAVFGGVALEAVVLQKEIKRNNGKIPDLYKSAPYIIIRIFVIFGVSGLLPYFMGATSLWNAVYIGISAPALIERLAQGTTRQNRQPPLPPAKRGRP